VSFTLRPLNPAEIFPCRECNPDRPARSQSLYHLSYPDSCWFICSNTKFCHWTLSLGISAHLRDIRKCLCRTFQLLRLGFFGFSFLGWGETESTWYVGHYLARMIDDDECGAVGGMKIGRGSRSTRRKPALVPLCPPQIPHDHTWARTRAAAVGNRRLTSWAMARLPVFLRFILMLFDVLGLPRGRFVRRFLARLLRVSLLFPVRCCLHLRRIQISVSTRS
jgi:hypothetical protein